MTKEFLVRCRESSNPQHGRYPGARPVSELVRNGIVILDKWSGPTSHDVAAIVKKLFSLTKSGHSGTLDPAVSGVLPITLENACKVIPALQGLDKTYVGVMHLHKDIGDDELQQEVKKFVGEITQLPPRRSAVARRERKRTVHSFSILDKKGRDVAFIIKCEAGTYIRKIVSDLGKRTGGAHMSELRRTNVGRFGENIAVRMQDLADSYEFWKERADEKIRELVLPIEAAVEHLGHVIVRDSAVAAIVNGSPLYTQGISVIEKGIGKGDLVAVLTLKGELVALAKAAMTSEEMLGRGLAAKTDRVVMEKGVYPRAR